MSYKRPFSAMERDSLSGSAEHDDSIWIQRKDRYREINREVPYVTPVRKEILTEELSKRYPLFKTKTFGQESREIAVNYILHNNEHYGLKPFAVSKTVDSLLRENNQFKCKVAQNYFREYDKNRLDHTYTKDSFALVKNCPMQDQEPLLACAPVSFYPPRPSAMPRPSSVAPVRRASVLPTLFIMAVIIFAICMMSCCFIFAAVRSNPRSHVPLRFNNPEFARFFKSSEANKSCKQEKKIKNSNASDPQPNSDWVDPEAYFKNNTNRDTLLRILEELDKDIRDFETFRREFNEEFDRLLNQMRTNSYSGTGNKNLDILGLKPGATAAEIKRAFRRKSLATHPDKVCSAGRCKTRKERLTALLKFREVAEAFEALSLESKAH